MQSAYKCHPKEQIPSVTFAFPFKNKSIEPEKKFQSRNLLNLTVEFFQITVHSPAPLEKTRAHDFQICNSVFRVTLDLRQAMMIKLKYLEHWNDQRYHFNDLCCKLP